MSFAIYQIYSEYHVKLAKLSMNLTFSDHFSNYKFDLTSLKANKNLIQLWVSIDKGQWKRPKSDLKSGQFTIGSNSLQSLSQ